MERRIRIVGLSFAIAWLALAAEAVEVTLQLESVTSQACVYDPRHYGNQGNHLSCVAAVSVPAVPAAPAATGSVVDVDALGATLGVFLSLPGYTLDGFPVAPWSGAIERLDSHTSRYAGQEGAGSWDLRLTRFSSQAEFAGKLVRTFYGRGPTSPLTKWTFSFSFAPVPNAGEPPCLGEILLFDDDADGKADHRDAVSWQLNASFGSGIDEWGRTIAEFCDAAQLTCSRADFRNDEALAKKPLDCRLNKGQCVPAEMFGPVAVSATPPRQCLGHAVITDSDGDAEPDATDRCADTPAGAFVDGNGCSAPQFCSQQSASACQRSDFRNDEPLAKKPFDCALTQSAPLACTAATP
jgi:hypothetical protein